MVVMYVRFPLSLRNVEDLLAERGIDICHETVRLWWNRFGPIFAGEIRSQRIDDLISLAQREIAWAFGVGEDGSERVTAAAGGLWHLAAMTPW